MRCEYGKTCQNNSIWVKVATVQVTNPTSAFTAIKADMKCRDDIPMSMHPLPRAVGLVPQSRLATPYMSVESKSKH